MARYIDADKLMHTLGIADECKKCTFCIGAICTNESDFVDACTAIAEAPTADVQEVKHGIWYVIHDEDWFGGGRYECSECGYGFSFGGFHEMDEQYYCPHCGAKMEVENKED